MLVMRLVNIICLLVVLLPAQLAAQNSKLSFLRGGGKEPTSSSRLIVFVHGIRSDSEAAWKHPKGARSWPEIVVDDPVFDDADVAVFDYATSVFRYGKGSINQIADQLEARLETGPLDRYENIIFVAHSMGGLVVRSAVNKLDNATKSSFLFFLATPTGGSKIAYYARKIGFRGEALDGLREVDADNLFLEAEISNWGSLLKRHDIRSHCFYENVPTFGQIVVEQPSATWLCNEKPIPIFENHQMIAKPLDAESLIHQRLQFAFKNVYGVRLMDFGRHQFAELGSGSNSERDVVVAKTITLADNVVLPSNAILIAQDIDLAGYTLRGNNMLIVAQNLIDGVLDASGNSGMPGAVDGELGGNITVFAAQISSGVKFVSRGGDGSNGRDGENGSDGVSGTHGSRGNCDGFGSFRSPRPGSDGQAGGDGQDGENGGNGADGGQVFVATLLNPSLLEIDVTAGKGGQGGRGGTGGQGGPGGIGGRGCIGLGGSKPNAADGRTGASGRDGRNGLAGAPGVQGDIWVRQLDSMDAVARLLPASPEFVKDYRDAIVPQLQALIKR